jgi:hypothetical protein
MTKAKYLGPNIPITVHSVDRAASRISIAYRDTDISRNSVVDTIFSFVRILNQCFSASMNTILQQHCKENGNLLLINKFRSG